MARPCLPILIAGSVSGKLYQYVRRTRCDTSSVLVHPNIKQHRLFLTVWHRLLAFELCKAKGTSKSRTVRRVLDAAPLHQLVQSGMLNRGTVRFLFWRIRELGKSQWPSYRFTDTGRYGFFPMWTQKLSARFEDEERSSL